MIVLGSVWLASLHVRGVASAVGAGVPALIGRLPRVDRAARLDALVASLGDGAAHETRDESRASRAATFEAQLAEALRDASSEAARAEAANEALGDLGATLESRSKWSTAALRIVLLGGLLCAALCLIRQEFVSAGIVAGMIAVGAAATAWLGSKASKMDKEHRKTADRLVELLLPDAPRETSNRGRFRDAW